ncbi:MAG: DUF5615 family PIN-like protein [Tepidisphaeraceae bacterium]
MKFLVDNQLPLALGRFLAARGHSATHVLEIGFDEASDTVIWRHVSDQNMVLISKDEDFLRYAIRPNATTSLLWVRLPNCRNSALLAAFDKALPTIIEAVESGQRVIELR